MVNTGHGRLVSVGLVLAALALHSACGDSPTRPSPARLSLTCSSDMETTAPDGVSTTVAFDAPVPGGGTPPVTSNCAPASGEPFPVGETVVRCTATDSRQQSATCQFRIRVNSPPRLERNRIIAFGDSITYGDLGRPNPARVLGPTYSYPARLHALLTSRYPLDTIVVFNEGRGGETTLRGVTRLPTVLTADKGELLLLLEGVNAVTALSTRSQISNLRAMVRTAKNRGLEVVIATLTPISNARENAHRGTRAAILALNAGIVSLARSEGIEPVVDLYTLMEDQPQLLGPDGLHPNAAGYAFMAEAFAEAIQTRFETLRARRDSVGLLDR